MGQSGLRDFLEQLQDEVIYIDREVDPVYEVTALLRKAEGRTLFCRRIKGSSIPLVGNVFGTLDKVGLAVGAPARDLLQEYLRREEKLIPPKIVGSGPVQEKIYTGDRVDLRMLPVPTINQKDGGPYINAGILVIKDPEFGTNLSLHRLQLKGERKTGIFFNPLVHLKTYLERAEDRGEPLPVAVVIGCHPVFYLASQVAGPVDLDEYQVAGALKGEPIELVKCQTVDLEVPADAEIVLEGFIPLGKRELEGPFGEFSGYYNLGLESVMAPVIEYTAITTRREPIFQTIQIGKPPTEEEPLKSLPLAASLYSLVKGAVPEVKDICLTRGGCARYHAVAAIKKRSDGDGKLALAAMLSSRIGVKHAVVVDEDIDVHLPLEVEWAIATRSQFDRDSLVMTEASHQLDPSKVKRGSELITKVGLDATRPVTSPFPEVCDVPEEIKAKVEGYWEEFYH